MQLLRSPLKKIYRLDSPKTIFHLVHWGENRLYWDSCYRIYPQLAEGYSTDVKVVCVLLQNSHQSYFLVNFSQFFQNSNYFKKDLIT